MSSRRKIQNRNSVSCPALSPTAWLIRENGRHVRHDAAEDREGRGMRFEGEGPARPVRTCTAAGRTHRGWPRQSWRLSGAQSERISVCFGVAHRVIRPVSQVRTSPTMPRDGTDAVRSQVCTSLIGSMSWGDGHDFVPGGKLAPVHPGDFHSLVGSQHHTDGSGRCGRRPSERHGGGCKRRDDPQPALRDASGDPRHCPG